MLSVSPEKSLLGQPTKARSLTDNEDLLKKNWSGAVALVRRFPGSVGQSMDATTVPQSGEDVAASVRERISVPKPIALKPSSALNPKQLFEGTVLFRTEGGFTARLRDLTNPMNPDEIAEFDLDEISPDDKQMVQPGAAFFWTLGTESSPAGQVTKVMRVSFRRLPAWNKASLRATTHFVEDVLSVFREAEEPIVLKGMAAAADWSMPERPQKTK